jgi:hypothetical protein
MLYNTNWEKTHNDVFSLESLIAWLEKQPASQAYDYDCNGHCMLAQYFTAKGFENVLMGSYNFDYGPGWEHSHSLPEVFNDIAVSLEGRTFGAALDRARKALAER